MEYFCLHTFHEENIVLSYYYITCMHTCGTYSNLAVSGSISKSSRTGDFGMLSRYLSEKQRVYDYEKISNTMCCNLLTTLGQLKLEKLYIDILLVHQTLCQREQD